jgi:hypothetical protein
VQSLAGIIHIERGYCHLTKRAGTWIVFSGRQLVFRS